MRAIVVFSNYFVQFYPPSVASSLFYRVVLLLRLAADAPALLGTLLLPMQPLAFVKQI
jgi:hypothetical protein